MTNILLTGFVVLVLLVIATIAALAVFTAVMARRIEKALPATGKFVDLAGARLHYVEEGSGPPVLLIHGLGGQSRHFTHSLVRQLSTDHRVITIDRPGSGYSTRVPGTPARLRHQAATIAQFIAALKLDRPVVVGHSLGGAIALALAIDHPEAVGALALVAPLTHPQESAPAAFGPLTIRSPLLRHLVAWTLAVPSAIAARDKALEPVFGPETAPRDFATAGGGALWLRPQSFIGASSDLVAANDDLPAMVQRYGTLTLPVGILYGDADQILDPRVHGEPMAGKIPSLELEIVAGGHMLPITQAERTAAFIRKVAARAVTARAVTARAVIE